MQKVGWAGHAIHLWYQVLDRLADNREIRRDERTNQGGLEHLALGEPEFVRSGCLRSDTSNTNQPSEQRTAQYTRRSPPQCASPDSSYQKPRFFPPNRSGPASGWPFDPVRTPRRRPFDFVPQLLRGRWQIQACPRRLQRSNLKSLVRQQGRERWNLHLPFRCGRRPRKMRGRQ